VADNVAITAGVGTTIGADEIAAVKYQRIKLIHGADGTNDGDVATANPLPVVQTGTPALPTGAATAAKQLADNHNVVVTSAPTTAVTNAGITSIDGKITACNTGAVTVAASALPTGASTAAKQPALGTAGTASADVITVQGVASMTPILATVSQGTASSLKAEVVGTGTFAVQAVCTNAGTFATQVDGAALTALQLIDNCISGSEAQVDVVAALPAGTNNIGDVDVLSFANGKTIKRAVISGATSGDNTIVAAVADKKIKVLSVFLIAATAVAVRFESGAGGTALTGVMSIGATGGFVLPPPADPTNHWFETGVNTLLNMELGGAVQVSGAITYYEEA